MVKRTNDLHQSLECGGDHFHAAQILIAARLIDYASTLVFLAPLAWLIQKLIGAAKEKWRVVFFFDERLRPWMLEFDATFRLVKRDARFAAFGLDGFHAEDGDFPLLQNRHFRSTERLPTTAGLERNPCFPLRAIPLYESLHCVTVWLTRANCFAVVQPKLTHEKISSLELRSFRSEPDIVFVLPS